MSTCKGCYGLANHKPTCHRCETWRSGRRILIPESNPTRELGTNRWALVDEDGNFDTNLPNGRGKGLDRSFTLGDTAGCSCEQIIDLLDLGKGHERFG
jgi:hypothetical protein